MRRTFLALAICTIILCGGTIARADDEGDQPGPTRREGLQPVARGDLADIRQRRILRILAQPDDILYRIQRDNDQSLIPLLGQHLERWFNTHRPTGNYPLRVVMVPTPADQIIPRLQEGRGDIGFLPEPVAHLPADINDSTPILDGLEPVIVTSDTAPDMRHLADLSGHDVLIAANRAEAASLSAVSAQLEQKHLPVIQWRETPYGITDNGALDLVRIGAADAVITDAFLANFWQQWQGGLKIHHPAEWPGTEHLSMLVRKESRDLLTEINRMIVTTPVRDSGSWLGDLKKKRMITTVTSKPEIDRFRDLWPVFRDLAPKYGLDPYIVAGLAYQESRLRQSARGSGGATGIMQLMPATGQHPALKGMPIDGSARDNIEAGLRYLKMLSDRFLNDPGIDAHNRSLMVLVAYHRGPAALERARNSARDIGIDTSIWFRHVDQAVARQMGQEPLDYVQNIAKYAFVFRQKAPDPAQPSADITAQIAEISPSITAVPEKNQPPLPGRKPALPTRTKSGLETNSVTPGAKPVYHNRIFKMISPY